MVFCDVCRIRMIKGHNEYYCPKCGLVKEDFNLQPGYDKDHGFAVPLWKSNFSQTKPSFKWTGGRPKPIWKIRESIHLI